MQPINFEESHCKDRAPWVIDEAAAATFQVTAQMAGFRMNATDVRMHVARTSGTTT